MFHTHGQIKKLKLKDQKINQCIVLLLYMVLIFDLNRKPFLIQINNSKKLIKHKSL